MRHQSSNYYKAAKTAKETAIKVFSKSYGNPNTPVKLISRAVKMVHSVGYRESFITGSKFVLGSVSGQIITRAQII